MGSARGRQWWTTGAAMLALTSSSGCGSEGEPGSGGANGSTTSASAGATAGQGGAASQGGAPAQGGGSAIVGVGGALGTGGGTAPCDPPPDAGTFWAQSALSTDLNQIDPVQMCAYRGDVLLVVNTAGA